MCTEGQYDKTNPLFSSSCSLQKFYGSCGGLLYFTVKYPAIGIQITNGTHEELYGFLRTGPDIVINDQRRAS